MKNKFWSWVARQLKKHCPDIFVTRVDKLTIAPVIENCTFENTNLIFDSKKYELSSKSRTPEVYIYCTATHPDNPNYKGKARGRKLHVQKSNTHTKCNMLVDEILALDSVRFNHFKQNGQCMMCFKGIENV